MSLILPIMFSSYQQLFKPLHIIVTGDNKVALWQPKCSTCPQTQVVRTLLLMSQILVNFCILVPNTGVIRKER